LSSNRFFIAFWSPFGAILIKVQPFGLHFGRFWQHFGHQIAPLILNDEVASGLRNRHLNNLTEPRMSHLFLSWGRRHEAKPLNISKTKKAPAGLSNDPFY